MFCLFSLYNMDINLSKVDRERKLVVVPLSYDRNDIDIVAQKVIDNHPRFNRYEVLESQEIPECFYHYEAPGLETFLNKFDFSMWVYCDLVPKKTNDIYLAITSKPMCDEDGNDDVEGLGGADYHIGIASTCNIEKEKDDKIITKGIASLVLHEAGGHCFGLKDHYRPKRSKGGSFCPMGTGYPLRLNGLEYCSSCSEKL